MFYCNSNFIVFISVCKFFHRFWTWKHVWRQFCFRSNNPLDEPQYTVKPVFDYPGSISNTYLAKIFYVALNKSFSKTDRVNKLETGICIPWLSFLNNFVFKKLNAQKYFDLQIFSSHLNFTRNFDGDDTSPTRTQRCDELYKPIWIESNSIWLVFFFLSTRLHGTWRIYLWPDLANNFANVTVLQRQQRTRDSKKKQTTIYPVNANNGSGRFVTICAETFWLVYEVDWWVLVKSAAYKHPISQFNPQRTVCVSKLKPATVSCENRNNGAYIFQRWMSVFVDYFGRKWNKLLNVWIIMLLLHVEYCNEQFIQRQAEYSLFAIYFAQNSAYKFGQGAKKWVHEIDQTTKNSAHKLGETIKNKAHEFGWTARNLAYQLSSSQKFAAWVWKNSQKSSA